MNREANLLLGSAMVQHHRSTSKDLPEIGVKLFEPSGSWLEENRLSNALDERYELIKEPRIQKDCDVAVGRWDGVKKKVAVVKKKGKEFHTFGHHDSVDNLDYLYPEEALFLQESNSLLVQHGNIEVSIELSYSLLLSNENGCDLNQYRIFSHLSRLGYKLIRHLKPDKPMKNVTSPIQSISVDNKVSRNADEISAVNKSNKNEASECSVVAENQIDKRNLVKIDTKKSNEKSPNKNESDSDDDVVLIDDSSSSSSESSDDDDVVILEVITEKDREKEIIDIDDDSNDSDIVFIEHPGLVELPLENWSYVHRSKFLQTENDERDSLRTIPLDLYIISQPEWEIMNEIPNIKGYKQWLYRPDERLLPDGIWPFHFKYLIDVNAQNNQNFRGGFRGRNFRGRGYYLQRQVNQMKNYTMNLMNMVSEIMGNAGVAVIPQPPPGLFRGRFQRGNQRGRPTWGKITCDGQNQTFNISDDDETRIKNEEEDIKPKRIKLEANANVKFEPLDVNCEVKLESNPAIVKSESHIKDEVTAPISNTNLTQSAPISSQCGQMPSKSNIFELHNNQNISASLNSCSVFNSKTLDDNLNPNLDRISTENVFGCDEAHSLTVIPEEPPKNSEIESANEIPTPEFVDNSCSSSNANVPPGSTKSDNSIGLVENSAPNAKEPLSQSSKSKIEEPIKKMNSSRDINTFCAIIQNSLKPKSSSDGICTTEEGKSIDSFVIDDSSMGTSSCEAVNNPASNITDLKITCTTKESLSIQNTFKNTTMHQNSDEALVVDDNSTSSGKNLEKPVNNENTLKIESLNEELMCVDTKHSKVNEILAESFEIDDNSTSSGKSLEKPVNNENTLKMLAESFKIDDNSMEVTLNAINDINTGEIKSKNDIVNMNDRFVENHNRVNTKNANNFVISFVDNVESSASSKNKYEMELKGQNVGKDLINNDSMEVIESSNESASAEENLDVKKNLIVNTGVENVGTTNKDFIDCQNSEVDLVTDDSMDIVESSNNSVLSAKENMEVNENLMVDNRDENAEIMKRKIEDFTDSLNSEVDLVAEKSLDTVKSLHVSVSSIKDNLEISGKEMLASNQTNQQDNFENLKRNSVEDGNIKFDLVSDDSMDVTGSLHKPGIVESNLKENVKVIREISDDKSESDGLMIIDDDSGDDCLVNSDNSTEIKQVPNSCQSVGYMENNQDSYSQNVEKNGEPDEEKNADTERGEKRKNWKDLKEHRREEDRRNDDYEEKQDVEYGTTLIQPENCSSIDSVLDRLQIFQQYVSKDNTDDMGDIQVSYDVYLPDKPYYKRHPPTPDYRLVILRLNDCLPNADEMTRLKSLYDDGASFLFAVALRESIAYYLYDKVFLPVDNNLLT